MGQMKSLKSLFLDDVGLFIPGTLFYCSCTAKCKQRLILVSVTQDDTIFFLSSFGDVFELDDPYNWKVKTDWRFVSPLNGECASLFDIASDV